MKTGSIEIGPNVLIRMCELLMIRLNDMINLTSLTKQQLHYAGEIIFRLQQLS
jgi:hypothetical protein